MRLVNTSKWILADMGRNYSENLIPANQKPRKSAYECFQLVFLCTRWVLWTLCFWLKQDRGILPGGLVYFIEEYCANGSCREQFGVYWEIIAECNGEVRTAFHPNDLLSDAVVNPKAQTWKILISFVDCSCKIFLWAEYLICTSV